MRVRCYSVKLKELRSISSKAFLAIAFDGSEDVIPKSQVLGDDFSVSKSAAYWISAWILEKKSIQYSRKKEAWIDSNTGRAYPVITVEHHIPKKINPINPDERLLKRPGESD